jgi:hypothetical protein
MVKACIEPGCNFSLGTAGYQNPNSGAPFAETVSGMSGTFIDEEGQMKRRYTGWSGI